MQLKKQFAKRILSIILSLIVIVLSLIFYGEKTSAVFFNQTRSLPIYRVDRNDKKISISFDCAWGVEYTDQILSVMDEYKVKCTFFAVRFWVEKYPLYVEKIIEHGHELGTHSATHPHMSKMSEEAILKELTSSSLAIENLTNKKVLLFRPPFGEYNNLVIDTAKSLNLYSIQWDVDSLDWKDLSAEAIAERVIKRVKSGSIILCHNNGLNTAKALPLIFSTLINAGYQFVPISELIYKDNYYIDSQGVQKPIN